MTVQVSVTGEQVLWPDIPPAGLEEEAFWPPAGLEWVSVVHGVLEDEAGLVFWPPAGEDGVSVVHGVLVGVVVVSVHGVDEAMVALLLMLGVEELETWVRGQTVVPTVMTEVTVLVSVWSSGWPGQLLTDGWQEMTVEVVVERRVLVTQTSL